jgi:hypothetical protein
LTIPPAAGFDGTVTLFETRRVLRSGDVNTAAGNHIGQYQGSQKLPLEFQRQTDLGDTWPSHLLNLRAAA